MTQVSLAPSTSSACPATEHPKIRGTQLSIWSTLITLGSSKWPTQDDRCSTSGPTGGPACLCSQRQSRAWRPITRTSRMKCRGLVHCSRSSLASSHLRRRCQRPCHSTQALLRQRGPNCQRRPVVVQCASSARSVAHGPDLEAASALNAVRASCCHKSDPILGLARAGPCLR